MPARLTCVIETKDPVEDDIVFVNWIIQHVRTCIMVGKYTDRVEYILLGADGIVLARKIKDDPFPESSIAKIIIGLHTGPII